ncbi:MAG: hypothetical protein H7328_06920 [Bdellovibrio sp.]|nr:hypothetical protein [Bdellovibrio sp.]
MLSYKPKAEPLVKRILQSGLFQISFLIVIAVLLGLYIIRSDQPQKWVQKITHFQGVTKPAGRAANIQNNNQSSLKSNNEEVTSENELQDLKNQEISIPVAPAQALITNSVPASGNVALVAKSADTIIESTSSSFRLTYAEVSRENLAKWINDSSNAGLYQNLQEYSAGILTDFRKRSDTMMTVLLNTNKKLSLGQSETVLSGLITEDASSQMLGLVSAIEYRTNENGVLHGSILVSRNNRQVRENFPAEYDLPRGAVFFLIGALKSNSFMNEKTRLTMPPFQILRSPDFMTQKTEFVIILEPEYK